MIVSRRVVRGVLQFSFAAAAISVLASCSSVTYGTGVGTTAQTFQDLTRPLNILNLQHQEGIDYAAPRPEELTTPATANLPPPVAATQTTATNQAPPPVGEQLNPCAIRPGDPAPPATDCTPNPNAPAVVQQGGGLFAGTPAGPGIRQLVDTCQWWQASWDQLNGPEQDAWGLLGWNATNWGTGTATTAGKSWRDLNGREKRAAESLGFDADIWNSCTVH